MVASDTVVGLVGAGILLVALVGVFIIESKEPASTGMKELADSGVALTATGSFVSDPKETPVNPARPDVCPPDNAVPPSTFCSPANTNITLTVTGLPALPEGGAYAAFFVNGADQKSLGVPHQMNGYMWAFSEEKEYIGASEIYVSFANAGAPPLRVLSGPITEGPISLTATLDLPISGKNATFTLTEVDGSLQGSVSVSEYHNYTGWHYVAWATEKGNASHYEHLGDLTSTGAAAYDDYADTLNATVEFGLSGHKIADLMDMLITLEPGEPHPGDDHPEGGEHPMGLVVARAAI